MVGIYLLNSLIYLDKILNNSGTILAQLKTYFPTETFSVTIKNCQVNLETKQVTQTFWLDEWAHKNDIVLAIIQSVIGKNNRVFARNCELKKIEKKQAEVFLNQNHLHGFKNAYYKYALIYNNEIMAVATFSKGRKMNRLSADKRGYELIGFCCKKGVSVIGGLSKLLKAFENDLHPGDIMTYVDKDWSEGKAYINLGFKLHSETPAQNFVFNTKHFTKHKINDENDFENYNEKANILVKNSGNLKLIYTPG